MQRLSIVVPCHNERESVETLLTRLCAVPVPSGWEREVIVVDDGSTDGTRELLERLRLPFRLLVRERNEGKGTALFEGFAAAIGSYVLIQDADLEYAPEEIPHLLQEAGPRTAVYGSRYRKGGRAGSKVLRSGVWFLTKLINILYGTKLTDVCTCYKLFPKEAARLWVPGRFEPELLFTGALVRNGYAIQEVPISYVPRTIAEGKKIKYRDGLRCLVAVFRDYLAHGRSGIIKA